MPSNRSAPTIQGYQQASPRAQEYYGGSAGRFPRVDSQNSMSSRATGATITPSIIAYLAAPSASPAHSPHASPHPRTMAVQASGGSHSHLSSLDGDNATMGRTGSASHLSQQSQQQQQQQQQAFHSGSRSASVNSPALAAAMAGLAVNGPSSAHNTPSLQAAHAASGSSGRLSSLVPANAAARGSNTRLVSFSSGPQYQQQQMQMQQMQQAADIGMSLSPSLGPQAGPHHAMPPAFSMGSGAHPSLQRLATSNAAAASAVASGGVSPTTMTMMRSPSNLALGTGVQPVSAWFVMPVASNGAANDATMSSAGTSGGVGVGVGVGGGGGGGRGGLGGFTSGTLSPPSVLSMMQASHPLQHQHQHPNPNAAFLQPPSQQYTEQFGLSPTSPGVQWTLPLPPADNTR